MAIQCVLIDDEELALQRLSHLLTSMPQVNVIGQFTSIDQAEQFLLQHPVDLVFLDIEMPEKSGLDVSDTLKSIVPHASILFTTAYDHYAIKAIRKGAFDYLLKPIDIDELKAALERFSLHHEVPLSNREKDIIRLVAKGHNSKAIGEKLFLSKHTVDTHRRRILHKTGCKNTAALIQYAIKHHLA